MADYIEMMDKMRDGQQSAARPRARQKAVKHSGLTRRKKTAAIHRSVSTRSRSSKRATKRHSAEEALAVARKAKRSKKQIAAARKNLRKARHARRSNPLVAVKGRLIKPARRKARKSGHRKSAKRMKAGKKAALTRARNRRSPKRSSAKRVHTAHRKSPKRVKAAKKAARTRARNKRAGKHVEYTPASHQLAAERPRRRRKNPIAASEGAAAPRRRKAKRKGGGRATGTRKYKPFKRAGYSARRRTRKGTKKQRANAARRGWDRRRGRKIRRNPIRRSNPISARRANPIRRSNPVTGAAEFFSGVFGVGFGFAIASVADRVASNHAYITGAGTSGGLLDVPVAGSIYNSEAILLPIWKGTNGGNVPWRLVAAGGSVIVPLAIASWIKTHPAMKSFFQLAAFGAIGRTAGKLIEDATAHLFSSNALVQKLFAPELAAVAKLGAGTSALPQAPAATFAGVLPHGLRRVGSAIQDHSGNEFVQVGNQFMPAPPPPPAPSQIAPIVTMAAPPVVRETTNGEPTTPFVDRQFTDLPWSPYTANPDARH